ncbi:unnamed protein product, partial [Brassica napus]
GGDWFYERNRSCVFGDGDGSGGAASAVEEDDTLSCCSGTSWSISEGGSNAKRHENVVNSESYDMVGKKKNNGVRMMHKNVTDGQSFVTAIKETNIIIRRNKKKKFRFLASIYRATNEMR